MPCHGKATTLKNMAALLSEERVFFIPKILEFLF